jgi:enoyl-CoA hydratase/3-hydroxyacyl-CoA dehydrogenase
MTKPKLIIRIEPPVAYLRLQRPRVGNRVDEQLAQELCDAAHDIEHDDRVALVVVEAAGDAFCLGVGGGGVWQLSSDFVDAVGQLTRPVIAAVRGDAIAEGFELALACDLRVFSDKARCGLPQIAQGYLPRHGGTQRLPRIIGRGRALGLLLTGRLLSADEAERMGLACRVVPKRSFDSSFAKVVADLAAKGPVALRYAKEAILKGTDLTFDQGMRLEEDLYVLLQTTEDRAEGVDAFLRKRKPRYRGK